MHGKAQLSKKWCAHLNLGRNCVGGVYAKPRGLRAELVHSFLISEWLVRIDNDLCPSTAET